MSQPVEPMDRAVDVVVVGLGLAGACAAIEAADRGASVVVLDRSDGGGSSAMSGGIIYAAATQHQAAAGYHDTAEAMYKYFGALIDRPSVSDETLRRFCEDTNANLVWLEEQGVPFGDGFWPYKTSNPPPGYGLYYSGSELCDPYRQAASPAPRGHKPEGDVSLPTAALAGRANFTGYVTMWHLQQAIAHRNIAVITHTAASRLCVQDDAVVGVEYVGPDGHSASVSTRGGVVLATGGFQANRELVLKNNALFCDLPPLGPPTSDGAGLELGQSVGGAVDFMNEFLASVSVPADSLLTGVMVGPSGSRVANERLYIGALGDEVIKAHNGRCWLIADADIFAQAEGEAAEYGAALDPGVKERLAPTGHPHADTIEGLADLLGVEPGALGHTVGLYNRSIAEGRRDLLGKDDAYRRPIRQAPFHAFDCSPRAFTSLGGLVVDEQSGNVVRGDASVIHGLYAAGRAAVGVCGTARTYHSGVSLSDCVFSGRRAGRAAAGHVLRPAPARLPS